MESKSLLRAVLNGTGWSILGVLVTLFLFYFTEYRRRYDVRLHIASDVDLVEVREQVQGLGISYNGEDLLGTGRQIRFLSLSLQNHGETILQDQYDTGQPFGLWFPESVVLSSNVTSASSFYLRERLSSYWQQDPKEHRPNPPASQLLLPKIILERNSSVTFRVLLLQPRALQQTQIVPLGKIANLKNIAVARLPPDVAERSSVPKLFGFVMLGYFTFFGLLFCLTYLLSALDSKRKKKRIAAFLESQRDLSNEEARIIELYRSSWTPNLGRILRALFGGTDVVDLEQQFKQEMARLDKRSWLLVNAFRRPWLWHLPPELVRRDGVALRLNDDNREFIKKFFDAMGELERS